MRIALTQFFTMLTVLFGAGEKIAKTIDAAADIGLETTESYRDELRTERKYAAAKLIEQDQS